MKARAKIIEIELNNKLKSITWDDFINVISALTPNEREIIISDLKEDNKGMRQVIIKNIMETLRDSVETEIDGYIETGSIPISVLKKIFE
jgi:hypothetical protein